MRTHGPRAAEVDKTDAVLVAHALKRLADSSAGLEANPPAAGAIYMRSRVLSRLARDREAYERAAWPLRVAAAAVVGLVATGLAILTNAAGATAAPEASLWVTAATPGVLLVGALLAVRD